MTPTPITREDRLALTLEVLRKVSVDAVPGAVKKLEQFLSEVEPRDESPQRGRRLAPDSK